MAILFTNNAESSLVSAIASTDTTITLQAGDGAKFPNPVAPDVAYVTFGRGYGSEVVKLTSRSGDALTVVRGQDGTTAQAWGVATPVGLRLPAYVAGQLVQRPELSAYALLAGSTGQVFNVANATANSHAVNLGQGDGRYLGIGAQAVDSAKLAGTVAASYALQSWVTSNYLGINATAVAANKDVVTDNRSTASSVGEYSKAAAWDFKNAGVAGIGGTYAALLSVAPWTDQSGGNNHQLGFADGGGLYYRTGTYSGGYGSWDQVATHSWANSTFLGISAQAADSAKLGGTAAASYALQSWVTGQNYITSAGAPVQSVAGRTGAVTLSTSDISGISGYLPNSGNVNHSGLLNMSAGNGFVTFGGSFTDLVNGSTWYGLGRNNISEGSGYANEIQLAGYYGLRLKTAAGETIMGENGSFTFNGNTIWHSGNLTNNNQLTNGAGYITGSGTAANANNLGGNAPAYYVNKPAGSGGLNGVQMLLRSDSAADTYNVQSWWDNTYWHLQGYNNTTYHAGVRVATADMLTGLGPSPSGSVIGANQILRSDGNGYTWHGWINTVSGDMGTGAVGSGGRVYCSNDAFLRYKTMANFGAEVTSYLGTVANATNASSAGNATTWAGSHQTQSTAAPSGGAAGDIWFQYS